ncbi:pheromone A receptor-domain-containing protein [Mycena crocata]|nr:pheromone A receptor-domain-containing protein [Mycena crocata]
MEGNWKGNTTIAVPVWCDIATKIKIGSDVQALPGCSFAIASQLNSMASGGGLSPRGRGLRSLEMLLCWELLVIISVLHFIVQAHRFDFIQDLGCSPAICISILILDVPETLLAALALLYCGMAVTQLCRRHAAFQGALREFQSFLSLSHYIRLIMAIFTGAWNVPARTVNLTSEGLQWGLLPWEDWDFVHADFSFVGEYNLAESTASDLRHYIYYGGSFRSAACYSSRCSGLGKKQGRTIVVTWIRRKVFKRDAQLRITDPVVGIVVSLVDFEVQVMPALSRTGVL